MNMPLFFAFTNIQKIYLRCLRGQLPTFIDGFLSHWLFQVSAGSILSDMYEQEMDVPQGSILSAVLFSLTFMIL